MLLDGFRMLGLSRCISWPCLFYSLCASRFTLLMWETPVLSWSRACTQQGMVREWVQASIYLDQHLCADLESAQSLT